jgi:hypothetical protein
MALKAFSEPRGAAARYATRYFCRHAAVAAVATMMAMPLYVGRHIATAAAIFDAFQRFDCAASRRRDEPCMPPPPAHYATPLPSQPAPNILHAAAAAELRRRHYEACRCHAMSFRFRISIIAAAIFAVPPFFDDSQPVFASRRQRASFQPPPLSIEPNSATPPPMPPIEPPCAAALFSSAAYQPLPTAVELTLRHKRRAADADCRHCFHDAGFRHFLFITPPPPAPPCCCRIAVAASGYQMPRLMPPAPPLPFAFISRFLRAAAADCSFSPAALRRRPPAAFQLKSRRRFSPPPPPSFSVFTPALLYLLFITIVFRFSFLCLPQPLSDSAAADADAAEIIFADAL